MTRRAGGGATRRTASRSPCTWTPGRAARTSRRRRSRTTCSTPARARSRPPGRALNRPATNRTHCIVWSDWATQPKVEKAHGIRFDTNYYYKGPPGWLTKPGLLTGSGLPAALRRPRRLDDRRLPGDDAGHRRVRACRCRRRWTRCSTTRSARRATTASSTVLNHTDHGDHANANDIVAAAQDRGVPVVSSAQMLDWLDGRNGSSFEDIGLRGGQLTFSVVTNPKARGLEAMLPAQLRLRPAVAADPRRPAGRPRQAHGQGRRVRRLQGRLGRLHAPPTPPTPRRRRSRR